MKKNFRKILLIFLAFQNITTSTFCYAETENITQQESQATETSASETVSPEIPVSETTPEPTFATQPEANTNRYVLKELEGSSPETNIINNIIKMLASDSLIAKILESAKNMNSETPEVQNYWKENIKEDFSGYSFDISLGAETIFTVINSEEKTVDVNQKEWLKAVRYCYETEKVEEGYVEASKLATTFTTNPPEIKNEVITEDAPLVNENVTENEEGLKGENISVNPTIAPTEPTEQNTKPTIEPTSTPVISVEPVTEETKPLTEVPTEIEKPVESVQPPKEPEQNEKIQNTQNVELVTIKINYLYESNNTQVFTPYVATMPVGTSFVNTVDSPVITGFDPWVKDEQGQYVDGSSIKLNFNSGVSSNIEYTVLYRPALVNYSVKYFFQNIENDLFTEDFNEYVYNAKGVTGTMPDDKYIKKQFEGFTTIVGDMEEIAADGSSEYVLYFERNKFSVIPDLDGGYGVEPIYAKYQSSFVLNQPFKSGYTFVGWDINGDGVGDELPPTIPSHDLKIKALWDVKETTYTVAYWKKSPDNPNIKDFIMNETKTAVSSSLVDGGDTLSSLGYDTTYLQYVDADKQVIVNGDGSTIVNVWYEPKEYNLRFYYAKEKENKYYVVGGSTYWFGNLGTNDNMTVVDLINNIPANQWGEVTVLPTLKQDISNRYRLGSITDSGTTYHYLEFNARYGQDLSSLWPVGVFNSVPIVGTHSQTNFKEAWFSAWNGERKVWYSQHNDNQTIKGAYQELDYKLLYDLSKYQDSNIVNYMGFWDNGADVGWSIPRQWLYKIWVPGLNEIDNTLTGVDEILYTFDTTDDSRDINAQTAPALEGFSYRDRTKETNPTLPDGRESFTANFYYTRNKHNVTLVNVNSTSNVNDIYYGSSLKKHISSPTYPTTYEENAYEFEGWYTSPLFAEGTKINLDTFRMPDDNVTLYANWVKTKHNIKVFANYADMLNNGPVYAEFITPHRNTVNPGKDFVAPVRNGYTFQGYFFINERGEKELFDFEYYPVIKDLKVYADWTSNVVTSYEIQFKLKGSDVDVAAPVHGRSFAGNTSTFYAKQGLELLEAYQNNYFPTLSSHSILMDTDHTKNIHVFEYERVDNIPYTIQYINAINGTKVLPDKVVDKNSNSIVTEKFEFVRGMIPDKFYKVLRLSTNPSTNIITFYYTPDALHSRYNINYYVEDLNGGYKAYSRTEGIGDIGNEINAPILNIAGYDYIPSKSTTVGTISGNGLELNLYYNLKSVGYTVKYLEYGTEAELSPTETLTGKVSSLVELTAKDIMGYDLVGTNIKKLKLTPDETKNEVKFFYRKTKANIKYEVIADEPCTDCTVGLNSETIDNVANISGSLAINNNSKQFDFVGWYDDELGTTLLSKEEKFVPTELKTATYYAHFKAIHRVKYDWGNVIPEEVAKVPEDLKKYYNGDKIVLDTTFKKDDVIELRNKDGIITNIYKFSGWKADMNIIDKADVIVRGEWIEITAKPDANGFKTINTGGKGWRSNHLILGLAPCLLGTLIVFARKKRN